MAGKLIAIIDDEPAMVHMLATFLQMKGFQVRGVYSGNEGLTLIQDERPAAVLLDLMLPDIPGIDICKRLRAQPDFATLPVIIISARDDSATMLEAQRAGANVYLVKPVRFPDLLDALQRLLQANPGG